MFGLVLSVLTILGADVTAIGYSDFSSIITAVTGQISVQTIVAVIASVIGITVGIAFMWWGAKYGVRKIWGAIKGRFSV